MVLEIYVFSVEINIRKKIIEKIWKHTKKLSKNLGEIKARRKTKIGFARNPGERKIEEKRGRVVELGF